MIEAWSKCPLPVIPEEKRVKYRELGICKGGCNCIRKIHNTTYQLCSNCNGKFNYFGNSCDVPECDSICDGSLRFFKKENKLICGNCRNSWQRMGNCHWDKFVEQRHLHFKRPETFVKALELGFIYPVENPVKSRDMAECYHCHRNMAINNTKYQLCGSCSKDLQYYGEKCSVGGLDPCTNDAYIFDTDESRFVCGQCHMAKRTYNFSSYLIYERHIRSITNCMLCKSEISHNAKEGSKNCTAYIDHDHDTNEVRGVLCPLCNSVEGMINKMPITEDEYVDNLKSYLNNPPLSKSWVQND